MVGIVLVSHSRSIAEGAARLARQMGGEDVRIETAGGLDTPDDEIGTDAVLVRAAIERAWSGDGVLVLMDLGSAVLSTEMALDLLPDEIDREKVVLSEAPFVEGAVAAAVTARIGASLEQVAAEARGGIAAKAAHLGAEDAPSAPRAAPSGAIAGGSATAEFEVETEHGLHARPAALLVRTASAFDAEVRVSNLTTGRGPASARSLNGVATLGVASGHRVEVSASGPQAGEAVDAVRALAERNFDEPAGDAIDERPDRPSLAAPLGSGGTMSGWPASPGVATGPAARLRTPTLDVPAGGLPTPRRDRASLDDAIATARRDVERQRSAIAGRVGAYRAAIFDAHLLFLDDEALLEPARSAIAGGTPAARAWADAVEAVAREWDGMDDEYQRARAADLRSVGTQVLARLLGVEPPVPELERPGILIAADLAPADAAVLDPATALGIATAFGGAASHAAILARALGIPAVVGLGASVLEIEDGTLLALDGDRGEVVVDPPPDVAARIEVVRRERAEAERTARAAARAPAVTVDGTTIEVAANVGAPDDVRGAVESGADGVGLLRTEFLFLTRDVAPTEDEQAGAYRAVADALDGRPLTIRTLDAGADKPLPFLRGPAEANPFLGVRGLRLGLERPELLEEQLRAVLRVAADRPVRVMFPMVATLDDLRRGRDALERAIGQVSDAERPIALEMGVMIEVPSAALIADRLAEEADFFSIGTNDLAQYTLAADRGNERVAALADPLHPSVLMLIARTAEAGDAAGIWTGVCGEIAGDPTAAPLLLGLGVRELSMSAPAIPRVKSAVRASHLDAARALADESLALSSAEDVRRLLREAAAER